MVQDRVAIQRNLDMVEDWPVENVIKLKNHTSPKPVVENPCTMA